jgi:hypothetical protein
MKNSIRKWVFGAMAAGVVAVVAGCLPFPLGDPAKSQADPKLAGYWMNSSDDERELIAMLPFDEHTYVVEDVKLKKQDDKWQSQAPPQIYKGWLTTIKDVRFLTLDPLQQHLPSASSDQKIYPTLRLTVEGDTITARPVNENADAIKAVKDAAQLQAVITRELNNPDIYSGEGGKFRHLDPDRDSEIIQQLYKP